jgi:hypothetical protein
MILLRLGAVTNNDKYTTYNDITKSWRCNNVKCIEWHVVENRALGSNVAMEVRNRPNQTKPTTYKDSGAV